MSENIHRIRVEEIKNKSIPFPLFYYEHGDPEFITQAIYIQNVEGINPLTVPQTISVVRETANGVKTTATYQLIHATKTPSVTVHPSEN